MVSMEVRSADVDDAAPFVYRPPLPNITNKPLSTFVQVSPHCCQSTKVGVAYEDSVPGVTFDLGY